MHDDSVDECLIDSIAGIRRGLAGMRDGTGEEAETAFESLRQELGIPKYSC